MADFVVRRAGLGDVPGLVDLLLQVCAVHAEGRPDLFVNGARKYTDAELCALLTDETRPVFVAVDGEKVLGHGFCVIQDFRGSNNMQPIVTVYIDDICVDEQARGRGVATAIYQHIVEFARELGAHNVTLNVWSCNPGAQKFYEKMGLVPYKIGMEQVL